MVVIEDSYCVVGDPQCLGEVRELPVFHVLIVPNNTVWILRGILDIVA